MENTLASLLDHSVPTLQKSWFF